MMIAMRKQRTRKDKLGFTLIEVMVVLFILLAMAGAGVVAVRGQQERANRNNTLLYVRSLSTAIELYQAGIGVLPTSDQGLNALLEAPSDLPDPTKWDGPYLRDNFQTHDPWGNPYQYQAPGERSRDGYDVWSFGPDGITGTDDDIGNWTK